MKTKTKIIAGAVILAVLAFAFWYGGSSPGLHGWNTGEAEEPQEQQEAQQPADEPLQTAEDDPATGPDEGTQTEETPA